jgi:hypothetical protein
MLCPISRLFFFFLNSLALSLFLSSNLVLDSICRYDSMAGIWLFYNPILLNWMGVPCDSLVLLSWCNYTSAHWAKRINQMRVFFFCAGGLGGWGVCVWKRIDLCIPTLTMNLNLSILRGDESKSTVEVSQKCIQ